MIEEKKNSLCKNLSVFRRQKSFQPVFHHIPYTGGIDGHHRHPGRHRLQNDQALRLRFGSEDEKVPIGIDIRKLKRTQFPLEVDSLRHPQLPCQFFERIAERPFAGDIKDQSRSPDQGLRHRAEEELEVFLRSETPHMDENLCLLPQFKAFSEPPRAPGHAPGEVDSRRDDLDRGPYPPVR